MVAQRKYTNKMFSLKEFNDHQTYEAMMMEYEANEKSKAERIAALKQAAAEEGLELFSGMADEYLPGVQWLGFGHNSDEGKISAISTSFDDAFLVTAGHDGGIVVWRNNMEVVRADGKVKVIACYIYFALIIPVCIF